MRNRTDGAVLLDVVGGPESLRLLGRVERAGDFTVAVAPTPEDVAAVFQLSDAIVPAGDLLPQCFRPFRSTSEI